MKYFTPINLPKTKPTINNEPTMTKQEFKDDCDPTKILQKYQRTGIIEHANQYEPVFGDQSSMTYHEAKELTANSESMFQDLPSSVRKEFNHDVGAYLDYISNPDNVESAKKGETPSSISTEKNEEETPQEKAEITEKSEG